MPTKKTAKTAKEEAALKIVIGFDGKYIKAIGRRKSAIARVRVHKDGQGKVIVNGRELAKYFDVDRAAIAEQPLKLTGHDKDLDVSVVANGGGINAQAEAIRHGLARALVILDPELKGAIKAKGWFTRDSREVERKKFGLKKARRAPQWSKR